MPDTFTSSESKSKHDKRLVDLALQSMTIDDIRELVREMDEELKQQASGSRSRPPTWL
jgi:hypothetical protein